jgi:Phosphopantetheinyl transferase
MIRTWIAEVAPLMESAVYERYFEALPTWRQEKADRLVKMEDKALSVGAWTLYERANAKYPKLQEFNLSHSGKYALCSFVCDVDCKVGCDVQEMKADCDMQSSKAEYDMRETKVGCDIQEIKKNGEALAKRFFTKSENDYVSWGRMQGEAVAFSEGLAARSENDFVSGSKMQRERLERFYRLWVLKESFAKATREGLQIGLSNFEVQFDAMHRPVLFTQPQRIQEQYYFKEYSLEDKEYKVAVCASINRFAKEIEIVKLED